MSKQQNFTILRKLLCAIGLSDERIDEIIARIQEWLLDDDEKRADEVKYPYHVRDDFLSPAELNFYWVLNRAVSDWAIVFTKVSLGDLFFAQTGDRGENQAYRNKIDRKHVDFLLCDSQTVKPILGIELDDKSHQKPDRQVRDVFVNGVFAAANLPLVHVPVKPAYSTEKLNQFLQSRALKTKDNGCQAVVFNEGEKTAVPTCPKCGAEMILRTAKSGVNKGNQFWGCSNFPNCRSIMPLNITN